MKNSNFFLLFVLAGLMSLSSCKKVEKEMMVTTGSVSNILTTTADVTGDILDLGDGATKYGHCYSTSPNPNVASAKSEYSSPAIGGFTSALTGLSAGTKYYIKAYLSRGADVVYGSEINFTTASADLPELTTSEVSGITKTGAVSGGNITNQGGTPVTARGACWSAAVNPTINDSKITSGSGTGIFSSTISGLSAGTKYYLKAYATNAGGTAYGEEVNFTTLSDVISPPTVTTNDVTLITSTSATSGGEVTSEGGGNVTAKGVCWGTIPGPSISESTTIDGSGPGSFVSNISGLLPGTTYYLRAYATNTGGTSYGNEKNFKTNSVVPTLTTVPVTSITSSGASSGGDITNTGGATILAKGVCWSTTLDPSISDNVSDDGIGSGTYTSIIFGLNPATLYYVRAYATNSAGTGYGNVTSFTSLPSVPTVVTTVISGITVTTAKGGGNVTASGGATVTAKGVCWSTNQNPALGDSYTDEGSGTGSYTSNLIGLTAGITYYVRGYATNSVGTAFGDQVTFTTSPPCVSFQVTHTAGDVAPVTKTVDYGAALTNLSGENKCWITRNLGADIQATSATDATESAAGWYWQFNRKQGYKHDGTTRTPSTTWITSIDQNSDWTANNDPCLILLGTGWRIPTNTEWTNADANGGWTNSNITYSSVLKIHPAGLLYNTNGSLGPRGSEGFYWSSNQNSSTFGKHIYIYNTFSYINNYAKATSFSLRCIRD